jgi:hypothetical protein
MMNFKELEGSGHGIIFNVLSQNLSGRTKESHGKPQSTMFGHKQC